MLGSLFDMFVQGPVSDSQRQNGLGVGLSVVRRLVELHSGSVRAISDGRTGSEFVVDLPLDLGLVTGERMNTQLTPVAVRPKRILIIDDNADASEALAMLLTNDGHRVETSLEGVLGISVAETFNPDVVLLDIGLAGMDGYEVARRLRESRANRNAMLVATTGYGLPADRRRSAEAGFDHHLTKPVDYEALLRVIATGTEGSRER
jgi:two-component system CheB/CheR fusion protein